MHEGEVDNKKRAIKRWLKRIKGEYNVDTLIIGMEDTGIYNHILLRLAYQLEVNCSVVNGYDVKHSLGLQRGKNDEVDARRVAEYISRFTDKLKVWKPKRKVVEKLRYLRSKRGRLMKAKNILCQYEREAKGFVCEEMKSLMNEAPDDSISAIQKDIAMIDKQIRKLIKSDENLKRINQILTSIPGVGKCTSSEAIVRTNEFKDFKEPKKFACTSGIAPFKNTSGKSIRGKAKVSHKAHKGMKKLLHMCAMSSIRSDCHYRDYYIRRTEEDNKNEMKVINAIRNKIVKCMFALVRKDTTYDENYQHELG